MSLEKMNNPSAEDNSEKIDGRRHRLTEQSINNASQENNPIKVIVHRTSGDKEEGWFAIQSDGEDVTVLKEEDGGLLRKTVSLEDLREWNSFLSNEQQQSIAKSSEEVEDPDSQKE